MVVIMLLIVAMLSRTEMGAMWEWRQKLGDLR
jgi:hypothetical protein